MTFPGKRGLQRRNKFPRNGETWEQFYARLDADKARRLAAQAIEARSGETGTGSTEGESAVPTGCAQGDTP